MKLQIYGKREQMFSLFRRSKTSKREQMFSFAFSVRRNLCLSDFGTGLDKWLFSPMSLTLERTSAPRQRRGMDPQSDATSSVGLQTDFGRG